MSSSTRFEGKMSTKQRNDFLKKYRKPFKIQANFDLSAYPRLHRHISVMKDNSGFFTSKNLIEVILSLPKLGYVPNESIEFKIHLINGSDKSITSSSLGLIQVGLNTLSFIQLIVSKVSRFKKTKFFLGDTISCWTSESTRGESAF